MQIGNANRPMKASASTTASSARLPGDHRERVPETTKTDGAAQQPLQLQPPFARRPSVARHLPDEPQPASSHRAAGRTRPGRLPTTPTCRADGCSAAALPPESTWMLWLMIASTAIANAPSCQRPRHPQQQARAAIASRGEGRRPSGNSITDSPAQTIAGAHVGCSSTASEPSRQPPRVQPVVEDRVRPTRRRCIVKKNEQHRAAASRPGFAADARPRPAPITPNANGKQKARNARCQTPRGSQSRAESSRR